MPSKKLKTPLIPERYYHIYNRGNNKEKLFYHSGDYFFFLAKYREYVSPYVDTYAYCLLPNHFHFLIRTKCKETITKTTVPNQLRKLFLCHVHRINHARRRTGGLFTKSYQRIEIFDETYLVNLVNYIHKNPIKHGVFQDYEKYIYSSYRIIINDSETNLLRNELFQWFGGIQEFIAYHKNDQIDPVSFNLLNIEEDDAII